MKIVMGTKQLLAEGRAHESQGRWEDAAAVYEQGLHDDPGDPDQVNRALIVYRKLKDSRRELQVIDGALRALQQRGKAIQDQWLRAHPKAARAGKAVLRSLGGSQVTALGANSFITKLLKRKEVVEKRLGGKRKSPQPAKNKAAGKPKAAGKTKGGKTNGMIF
jgi:tetratricopeptide (TPR) repeat protein